MVWVYDTVAKTLEVPKLLAEMMGWGKGGPGIAIGFIPGSNTVVLSEADHPGREITVIFCRG